YDPCCGTGYLLTILGFLHGNRIKSLYGSDNDIEAAKMASDNLHLLTNSGLQTRQNAIQQLVNRYQKTSHREALASINRLAEKIPSPPIDLVTWQANALEQSAESESVDVVICDVPYGEL